jgi:uncharacterized membrane protein
MEVGTVTFMFGTGIMEVGTVTFMLDCMPLLYNFVYNAVLFNCS